MINYGYSKKGSEVTDFQGNDKEFFLMNNNIKKPQRKAEVSKFL